MVLLRSLYSGDTDLAGAGVDDDDGEVCLTGGACVERACNDKRLF